MASRHDLVLAVIPALVAVGAALELATRAVGVSVLGTSLAALPLRTGGFTAALAVIGHVVTSPVDEA